MPATLADIQEKYGDSVYPLYKDQMHEPYMECENGNGYLGVVLYDRDQDKIISHLSGKPIKKINKSHLVKYGMNSFDEYRQKFGLNKNVPLQSVYISEKQRHTAVGNIKAKKMNDGGTKRMALKASKIAAIKATSRPAKNTVMWKNKSGLCDAQIAARLTVIKEIVGSPNITSGHVLKYDKKLYYQVYEREGGIKGLLERLNIIPAQEWGHKYDDAFLLGRLRKFVLDNKRIPTSSDFDRGAFYKHFGSWRRAKMMAGLDQLLAEVKAT